MESAQTAAWIFQPMMHTMQSLRLSAVFAITGARRWTGVLTMGLIDVDDLGVGRCSRDVVPAAYCAGWNGLLNLIENAPTVDAVVVTRCKDCKYYNPDEYECGCDFAGGLPYIKPDDFCSYGEPKEG
nr:MAG TPA: high-potential iron protein ligated [Caudoviricetes sp.]